MPEYSDACARSGVGAELPAIETWPNRYRESGYVVEIECAEFTSVCPKTGLPDFGTLILKYRPAARCLELKSFKLYLLEYRNLGIFQENVVNKVLDDVVRAADPSWARVVGLFKARGGLTTTVTAEHGA